MDWYLKVRSEEYIGISLLTFRKTKPSKESAIREHFLNVNDIPSLEESIIPANVSNKFVLELKENLPVKRDRPVLNKKH